MKEISMRGGGDYFVGAPSFPLMEKKVLPEMRKFFEDTLGYADYRAAAHSFVLNSRGRSALTDGQPCTIFLGHAQNPDSLESATYKGGWVDEWGQGGVTLASWEALKRRMAIHRGRILSTTTPYVWNWFKDLSDTAANVGGWDDQVEVINFSSLMNPRFSMDEWVYTQKTMPKWRFDMMYRGLWRKPAGNIYDVFNEETDYIEPFKIPEWWPHYIGVDFGTRNTAVVKMRLDPTNMIVYQTHEYLPAARSVEQHVQAIVGRGKTPMAVGGARSENEWRREYARHGLPIRPPSIADVNTGIQKCYNMMTVGRFKVFNTCPLTKRQIEEYSYELDAAGVPTDRIANKNRYHLLDAVRYILSQLALNIEMSDLRVVNTLKPDEGRTERKQQEQRIKDKW
jgi:hypothetical protein